MVDKDNLLLTAVGPDKVGLVEKIAGFVAERGCNIEDSRMAVFCGEFALILLISGESKKLVQVANAYHELGALTGLNVLVKSPAARRSGEPSLPYRLTASCMDHPGVVLQLSGVLRSHGINIDSMETQTYAAPVSGTPIFRLEALLSVPTGININALREQFAGMERTENIDVELSLVTAAKPAK
jgi:glycine cleavage system transcriptional repressor